MDDEFYSGLMVHVFDTIASDEEYDERAKVVVSLIKEHLPEAKKILEVACGTGNFTKRLVDAGFKVTGTDIAEDEIAFAKEKDIKAEFEVENMANLSAEGEFDVVCCFWESFRYLESYGQCLEVMRRVRRALNPGGLFFVDFTHFPPNNEPFAIPDYITELDGLKIIRTTYILTEGDFDTRWDEARYELDGNDVTNTTIEWNGKQELLKPRLKRAPLLRISREKMEDMLREAELELVEVKTEFAGCPESMLFVCRKK